MPSRAPRACGLCGGTHAHGTACAKARARHQERKAVADKRRPSARERGYTAAWERESKAFLAVYGSCVRCGRPATLVDHRKPHRGDQTLFWDRTNWAPMCTPCHSGPKQAAERRSLERN